MKTTKSVTTKQISRVVRITGKTYDVRDKLRMMGGFWSPEQKCWLVPEERAAEARRLVRSAAPQPPENFIIVDEDQDFNGDEE